MPHVSLSATLRVDAHLALRSQINAVAPIKVSIDDLLVKAAAHACPSVPGMKVRWAADAVRRFESVGISAVIGSDRGLATPLGRGR